MNLGFIGSPHSLTISLLAPPANRPIRLRLGDSDRGTRFVDLTEGESTAAGYVGLTMLTAQEGTFPVPREPGCDPLAWVIGEGNNPIRLRIGNDRQSRIICMTRARAKAVCLGFLAAAAAVQP